MEAEQYPHSLIRLRESTHLSGMNQTFLLSPAHSQKALLNAGTAEDKGSGEKEGWLSCQLPSRGLHKILNMWTIATRTPCICSSATYRNPLIFKFMHLSDALLLQSCQLLFRLYIQLCHAVALKLSRTPGSN